MIPRIDHIAVAVESIEESRRLSRDQFVAAHELEATFTGPAGPTAIIDGENPRITTLGPMSKPSFSRNSSA